MTLQAILQIHHQNGRGIGRMQVHGLQLNLRADAEPEGRVHGLGVNAGQRGATPSRFCEQPRLVVLQVSIFIVILIAVAVFGKKTGQPKIPNHAPATGSPFLELTRLETVMPKG